MRRLLVVLLLLGGLLAAPARAEGVILTEAPEQPSPAAAQGGFILAKTAAYEVGTSALEAGLMTLVFGGGVATFGPAFAAVLAATSAVYITHEYVWEWLRPTDMERDDGWLVRAKTVTYRVADTTRNAITGGLLTGAAVIVNPLYAATLTVAELGLYAANELIFANLRRTVLPNDP